MKVSYNIIMDTTKILIELQVINMQLNEIRHDYLSDYSLDELYKKARNND